MTRPERPPIWRGCWASRAGCGASRRKSSGTPIPAVQYHMDEPLADAAAVALYFLNGEAARDVKVCLSGEGRRRILRRVQHLQGALHRPVVRPSARRAAQGAGGGGGTSARRAGGEFSCAAGPAAGRSGTTATRRFSPSGRSASCCAMTTAPFRPFDLARPYWRASGGLDPVTRMQGCDLHLWLAGDILLKADKMSMAHSLELRVPFLDREVFALARRLPPDAKADARQTKKALRAAAARHLPLPSAQRKKRGFPVPVRGLAAGPGVRGPGAGSFRQSGGGAVLSGAAAAYPVRPALAAPAGQLAADLLHLLLSGLVWAIFWE